MRNADQDQTKGGEAEQIDTDYADEEEIGERPADVAVLSKPIDLTTLSRAVRTTAE